MQRLINTLRGSVLLEAGGHFPERFLNLCAQAGIGFWGLEWRQANTLRLWVARRDVKRLEALAEKAQCCLTILQQQGAPCFLARFRRRYALLLGLALSLTAVCVLSQFILKVEVEGNEQLSAAVILEELHRLGVRPGAYSPAIDENLVNNGLLLRFQELSWVSVNLHGTRAEVLVRERVPRPEVVEESIPAHVVAETAGVLTRVEVYSGDLLFQPGDTVAEGDVVISGIIDLREPLYSESDLGTLTVRAQGKVYARTWRTLTAVLPLTAQLKEYTGHTRTAWSLDVLGRRFCLWGEGAPPFERYESQKHSWTLTMPGGWTLPLTLSRETAREYTPSLTELDPESGEAHLRERLELRLAELMEQTEGEIIQIDVTASVQEGMLTVALQAECSEQIGQTVEFEGTVGERELPFTDPGSGS